MPKGYNYCNLIRNADDAYTEGEFAGFIDGRSDNDHEDAAPASAGEFAADWHSGYAAGFESGRSVRLHEQDHVTCGSDHCEVCRNGNHPA